MKELDEVRQEEEKKLAEVESKIDSIASGYEQKTQKLNEQLKDYVCYDYEDRDRYRFMIHSRDSAKNEADRFRTYQDSPYFARMEFEGNDNDVFEVYVGDESIGEYSNQIVIDWRTELGSAFYSKNQTEFTVNEYQYKLLLRRAVQIKKAKLIDYNTEYDVSAIGLEGEVIDPFLLTVLRDKRRQTRLTNIIRTIQQNQNDIIRRPLNETFIVQGCAGSGKTMIMLHRLSYLLFNNKNMPLRGVKIITPNKYFDAYINDLSVELGLTSIARFSVEEYYVDLIHRYSSKIELSPEVHSEKTLDKDLLTDLYSVQYMFSSIEHYNDYWNRVISELEELRLGELYSRFSLKYPDTSLHTADTFSILYNNTRKISSTIIAEEKKKAEYIGRIDAIRKNIEREEKNLTRIQKRVNSAKEQVIVRIQSDIESLSKEIQSYEDEINGLSGELHSLDEQYSSSENKTKSIVSIINLLSDNRNAYMDYDNYLQFDDEISRRISAEVSNLISSISTYEHEYEKTPLYNFRKRNKLRKEINEQKEEFKRVVSEYLSALEAELKSVLSSRSQNEAELYKNIELLKEAIEAKSRNKNQCIDTRYALVKCGRIFFENDLPDTDRLLSDTDHNLCLYLLSVYEQERKAMAAAEETLKNDTALLQRLENEYRNICSDKYSDQDIDYIKKCVKVLERLRLSEIFRRVMFKDLFDKYREYGQPYYKANYRHKLYLRLLFCSFYYPDIHNPDTFLNIDEAQDISVSEYRMLKAINGRNCVLNLYGDINQSVYTFKGIQDWEDIKSIAGEKIYVLNENYRNTVQITEYCNSEFDAEVVPIGITGDDNVLEMTTAFAVEWIKKIKKQNPSHRTAIIYRYGVKEIQDALHELLKDADVSWSVVDNNKLSVISVETAKGLEFEEVVAIVSQMTNNEKYISFTRALNNLVVVRDSYAAELSDENEVEDTIEAEFTEPLMENLDDEISNVTESESSSEIPDLTISESAEYEIVQDDQIDKDLIQSTDAGSVVFSEEDESLINEFNAILRAKFDDDHTLNEIQREIVCSLYHGVNVACCAPSGFMKTVMLYLLILKSHKESGKQSLLTSESYLQENELVLAERLGLSGGYINSSMKEFLKDFKKEKYDVIFVPYEFFQNEENTDGFISYFSNNISFWGIDHPENHLDLWRKIIHCGAELQSVEYAMTKESFGGVPLDDFRYYKVSEDADNSMVRKITFTDPKLRINWIIEHLDDFHGQGIIYCNDESSCKVICKQLRKKRMIAEAYIDVMNPKKSERVNYLTNSFTGGSMPILVTTQKIGTYLSNPRLRFIIHYDIPSDRKEYQLHISQIGKLAVQPVIYDFIIG